MDGIGYEKYNGYIILLSGVGKTTLTKKFSKKYSSFKISVSHTTRSARSNEVEGVDYHFVSREEFEKLIKEKNFMNMLKFLIIIMVHQKKMLMKTLKKMILFLT